jgi:putative N6-adenine-specific DNA methylase
MTTAHEKRIRRHVIGREHDFFAITTPGLEELCHGELAALGVKARAVPGGVEFSGRLNELYRANLNLRTASRVLMRVQAFRATSFRALENEVCVFPWELFIPADAFLRIQVATHHCRLHHTGAIAERVSAAVRSRLGRPEKPDAEAPVPEKEQQIFVRGLDDRFVLSIDSSGANLYLRGVKSHPGRAPLRETIAAACLMRAGFSGKEILVDPMCGTGSFALEAALIVKEIPAGWFRQFAFMRWPGFSPPAWEHLRQQAAGRIAGGTAARIFASDIDPEACRLLGDCLQRSGLSDAVALACRDFFDIDPRRIGGRPGVVVLNPPYGRRLGRHRESRELRARIFDRLGGAYGGWKFILIAPEELSIPAIASRRQVFRFVHGGLAVKAVVGII